MCFHRRPTAIKVLCHLQGESEEKLHSQTLCICLHRECSNKGIHNVCIKMQKVVQKAL